MASRLDTEEGIEPDDVIGWRARMLVKAGYSPGDAFQLAENPDVDLHVAVYLLESGCPVETALRILL